MRLHLLERLLELNQAFENVVRGLERMEKLRLFNKEDLRYTRAEIESARADTQRSYRHLIRRHLIPFFGDHPLCEIKRQHVQGFVTDKMTRQKFSWKTTMHVRNLLGKILSTAVDWEYLPVNPVRGVKLPARPLREDRRFLTIDEVTRLLKALDGPAYTLILSAVLTGMRIGELLALRWKNVDFERKVIRVREAVFEGHVSTPKTRSGLRDIPIGPALEHALREHNARSRIADDSLVFPARHGTYQRPGNLYKRRFFQRAPKQGFVVLAGTTSVIRTRRY